MRLAAAILCVCGLTVFGQGTKPDVGTGEHRPEVDFFDSTADYFRISSRAVEAIFQKGIPAQEIPAVLMIARKAPTLSPNQVIEARKSGKSFEEIARGAKVSVGSGKDIVTESNVVFLSEYHGQPRADVERLHARGASWVDINQQYRRVGVKPRTERPAKP